MLNQRATAWYEQHGQDEDVRRMPKPWTAGRGRGIDGATSPVAAKAGVSATSSVGGASLRAPSILPVLSPQRTPERNLRDMLTFREIDVLLLLYQRLTNKEIARSLSISPETVRQHAINIFRKLGVNNRRQAVVQANAMGLQAAAQPVDCRRRHPPWRG